MGKNTTCVILDKIINEILLIRKEVKRLPIPDPMKQQLLKRFENLILSESLTEELRSEIRKITKDDQLCRNYLTPFNTCQL